MAADDDAAARAQVQAELLAREPIFHRPELGTTREDYLAQTAQDYWEVGASGRVYDREGVICFAGRLTSPPRCAYVSVPPCCFSGC